MQIPWKEVAPDILNKLLEEIVSRDGTDYGAVEFSLEEKVKRLLTQLKTGRAILYWDTKTETTSVLSSEQGKEREAEFLRREKSEL